MNPATVCLADTCPDQANAEENLLPEALNPAHEPRASTSATKHMHLYTPRARAKGSLLRSTHLHDTVFLDDVFQIRTMFLDDVFHTCLAMYSTKGKKSCHKHCRHRLQRNDLVQTRRTRRWGPFAVHASAFRPSYTLCMPHAVIAVMTSGHLRWTALRNVPSHHIELRKALRQSCTT